MKACHSWCATTSDVGQPDNVTMICTTGSKSALHDSVVVQYSHSNPLEAGRKLGMTVCIAAVACEGTAIVLIADKALTYGGITRPAVQGETGGIDKRLPIGESGWNALFAGVPSVAEDVVQRASSKVAAEPSIARSADSMMDCMKVAYQEAREQAVLDQVLSPNMLTKETFAARAATLLPLQDDFFLNVAQSVGGLNLGGDLLVCGFDQSGHGHIFLVSNPGVVSSQDVVGFGAIGVGLETGIARLLWNAAEPEDDLDVAMYQVF